VLRRSSAWPKLCGSAGRRRRPKPTHLATAQLNRHARPRIWGRPLRPHCRLRRSYSYHLLRNDAPALAGQLSLSDAPPSLQLSPATSLSRRHTISSPSAARPPIEAPARRMPSHQRRAVDCCRGLWPLRVRRDWGQLRRTSVHCRCWHRPLTSADAPPQRNLPA
jgi:hypothetical protein